MSAPGGSTGANADAAVPADAQAAIAAAQTTMPRADPQTAFDAIGSDPGQETAAVAAALRFSGASLPGARTPAAPSASLASPDSAPAFGVATSADSGAARAAAPDFAALLDATQGKNATFSLDRQAAARSDSAPALSGPAVAPTDPPLAALQAGSALGATIGELARASLHVGTPVGDPGFGQDISRQLVYLAKTGTQSAELSLQPANLGPISVSIQMNGNAAAVAISASHEATRAALQDALPHLQELFQNNGLHLAGAHVGDGSQRNADTGAESRHAAAARPEAAAAPVSAAQPLASRGPRPGEALRLIDTFA